MIDESTLVSGTVYTCTTLYAAAEQFEKDLPFQIAIVVPDEGERVTARIEGERVAIGDRVLRVGEWNGVSIFSRDPEQEPATAPSA
jgi:uncharacterized OB-fold protein